MLQDRPHFSALANQTCTTVGGGSSGCAIQISQSEQPRSTPSSLFGKSYSQLPRSALAPIPPQGGRIFPRL